MHRGSVRCGSVIVKGPFSCNQTDCKLISAEIWYQVYIVVRAHTFSTPHLSMTMPFSTWSSTVLALPAAPPRVLPPDDGRLCSLFREW